MRKLDTAEGDTEEEILREERSGRRKSHKGCIKVCALVCSSCTNVLPAAWSRKLEDYTKLSYDNRPPVDLKTGTCKYRLLFSFLTLPQLPNLLS